MGNKKIRKYMKLKYSLTLLAFSLVGLAKAQTTELSLSDCLNYGLENSPYMTISENEMKMFKYDKQDVYSPYLPHINGSAGLDYNAKLPVTVIPAGSFSPTEIRMKMGSAHANNAVVQLEQKIYDQTIIIGIHGIKDMRVLYQLNSDKIVEDFIYNLSLTYYQVLIVNQQIKLLEENESKYAELEKILKLQLEKGVIKQVDYNRVKVAYNNILSQLSLIKSSKEVAINNLKVVMGMPLDNELKIDEQQQIVENIKLPTDAQIDITNRLDYKINEQTLKLQNLNTKVMRYSFLPTISGYARYGANSYADNFKDSFKEFYDFASIGLKLTVPIFNGLKSNIAYNKQRIQTLNLETQNKIMSESYKVEYLNSRTKLQEAFTSFQNNKENLELAKDVYDVTSLSYQMGASSLSDFLNADFAYKEAQNNYMTSTINFLSSRLNFEKSKGNLSNYLNLSK